MQPFLAQIKLQECLEEDQQKTLIIIQVKDHLLKVLIPLQLENLDLEIIVQDLMINQAITIY
tara:strand:+ start:217 stop:402 length:186 start_codon:yes stop_codon:yes gene_type:complete